MTKHQTNQIKRIRAGLLVIFCCLVSCGFIYSRVAPPGFVVNAEIPAMPRSKARTETRPAKYSEFPHNKHKLACNSCHKFPSSNWKTVRKTDAFPDVTDYPRHESCLNCHRQQFFKGAKPTICSICHTNPSPNDSSRHPFPNPREIFDQSPKGKKAVSDFAISFPHDKHIEIVGANKNEFEKDQSAALFLKIGLKRAAASESCVVCHQTYEPQGASDDEYVTKPPAKLGDAFWLKKGTFKTVPTGHTTCFTCHSADTGILPEPSNCAACHKLAPAVTKMDFDARTVAAMSVTDKIMLTAWRKRESSATFRHEFSSHAEMDCASCHNVAAMNTTDALTKKVPVNSCNTCHITETSDDGGILNFEIDSRKTNPKFQCVKCHLSYGKSPIPASHFKAIADLAGK